MSDDHATGLEFLPNPGGDAEGLSDAGIEWFRDKPFAAVARETGQNSRDARLDPDAPVKVTFDVVTLKADEFPSIDSFRDAAGRCLAKAKKVQNEKTLGFFTQAVKALSAANITVLRISDFNTKGVRGPCQEGKPFHTLAKAEGESTKDDINAGGSFGIGKSAVFALSDIQTAFFSTRYKDDAGKDHVLCMGKTQFVSHTGADGKEKRRKGYWGKRVGYMPLDDAADIPQWLLRETQGTSIYSVCMRANTTDWRYEMTAALLINFFTAIERGEMEFEIDNGAIKVNRGTIQSLFGDNLVNKAVNQLNERAVFDEAQILHACLIDEKTTTKTLDVKDLGKVHLRVLLRDGLGYRVGIIRNGMYITNNLSKFNEPFNRFPLYADFAAIIEPAGASEGEWFKRLENPRHDDLSAERITDPALRAQGQRAFDRLAKQIRQTLRELAKSEPTSSMELDELNDFFASDEARTDDDNGPETDPRSLKPTPVKPAAPRPRRKVANPDGEEDGTPGNQTGGGGGGGGGGDGPGEEPGKTPIRKKVSEPITLQKERNILPDATQKKKRRLLFTAPVAGKLVVSVEATGLSTPEPLAIVAANDGDVADGTVEITCVRGQRVLVDVEFDTAYAGPIELSAIRHEPEEEAAA